MKRGQAQKGNALLIVLVVIAVISTLGLSVIQFAIFSSRSVIRTEDSINSYLIATSALEDGLLRWKFDRDIEAPVPGTNCSTVPFENSNFFDRINLTTRQIEKCFNTASSPPPSDQMVYDIKVFHRLAPGKKECVGNLRSGQVNLSSEDSCIPVKLGTALSQDQAVEYDIKNITDSIDINWKFGPQGPRNKVLLEVVSLGANCSFRDKICNKKSFRLIASSGNPVSCNQMTRVCSATFYKDQGDTLRIKPFGAKLDYYIISSNNRSDSLDTRFTEMDVTGYYGGVKRRLRLKLDRLTGQALPLYDFALFSGESDI